jgi:hypothetical protein
MAAPITPKPAQRTQRKARVGLWGKSGSGKTWTALKLARGLAGPDGKILVLDTEDGSSTIYADTEAFDVLPIEPPYDPLRFAAILATVAPHYEVVILDSTSHEWTGPGGCLDQIDVEKLKLGDNAFAAWSKITPKHNRFVEALTRCSAHVICCLRAKTTYKLVRNERTKKLEPVMTGEAPIQREEVPYELDVLARLEPDGSGVSMSITKSRYRDWHGKTFSNPDVALGAELAAWLSKGVTPVPTPDIAGDTTDERPEPPPAAPPPETLDPHGARAAPHEAPRGPLTRGEQLGVIRTLLFQLEGGRDEAGMKARVALMQACFGVGNMGDLANQEDTIISNGLRRLQAKAGNTATASPKGKPTPRTREPGEEG